MNVQKDKEHIQSQLVLGQIVVLNLNSDTTLITIISSCNDEDTCGA